MQSKSVILGLFVAACAMGCAPPPKAPPPPPVEHAVPEHDTSGLTILLAPEVDASETRRAITETLRAEMLAAGYKVVPAPDGAWDVELITRVDVWGRDFELGKNPGDAPDVREHIKLTVSAVALHDIVASTRYEFTATNGKISADDVVPALNALATSPRFRSFGAKVQHDREARGAKVATQ